MFFRGLGRPQGLAFDRDGNLYAAASHGGRRGILRIDQERQATHFLSGHNIVGLCFLPSRSLAVATNNSIYRVDVDIAGLAQSLCGKAAPAGGEPPKSKPKWGVFGRRSS